MKLAHDLRSSVRAISIYVDLIARETQDIPQMPKTISRYCEAISDNIEELAEQIDALAAIDDRDGRETT